jgi:hypothetical protein
MELQLNAAAVIAASVLAGSHNPSAEEIADVLERAMEGVQMAISRQNSKNMLRHAELKTNRILSRTK